MQIADRFKGCIIGGAIGDAWGSAWEFDNLEKDQTTWYWGKKPEPDRSWKITDDTQLTLATCEILGMQRKIEPAVLAAHFLLYYKQGRLSGVGASTLKALRDLDAGIPWQYAGRGGEYAAGNGAAMRIAPLAFCDISRNKIFDVCRITHHHTEAYAGALAVVLAIRSIIEGKDPWSFIINQLPDTLVRDRIIAIKECKDIKAAALLGNNGYVVNSIPFAIFAAFTISGIEQMYSQIIATGGDTDTNASIAGQIKGAQIGINQIPVNLYNKIKTLPEYDWMERIINSV
ncbi:ADP-ribosylglycohydrolase family protein [Chitinophaga sancti]|uniref:ADP-ribosylglycohydrolase family protein n=1 Tax=Chitinophaga sancti TaxID=1004 RepID=UPI003F794102